MAPTTFTPFARLTVVAVFSVSMAAAGVTTPNPYARIAEKNVFRLQPLPSGCPIPAEKAKRLLPKIFITGLFELRGVPKALVEITEPGQPVKRPILAAGGTCDLLEILQIDVAGEHVRVRLDGEEETLSIERPKPPAAAPPPPPPLPLPGPFRASVPIRG